MNVLRMSIDSNFDGPSTLLSTFSIDPSSTNNLYSAAAPSFPDVL